MTTPVPTGPKLEDFEIRLASGEVLFAALCRVPKRRTGRRIVVRNEAGVVLWDSRECYDLANATASLDGWLDQRTAAKATPQECDG